MKDVQEISSALTDAERTKLITEIKQCQICEKDFVDTSVKHVLDRCHLTGTVRGITQNFFNVIYQISREIPIIFYNLSGYDGHFIFHEIVNSEIEGQLTVI